MSKRNKKDIIRVIDEFLQQYGRKRRRRGLDPNDRHYDRKIEQYISRMKPDDLDEVLNGEVNDRLDKSN
jgi:hypothetical protein